MDACHVISCAQATRVQAQGRGNDLFPDAARGEVLTRSSQTLIKRSVLGCYAECTAECVRTGREPADVRDMMMIPAHEPTPNSTTASPWNWVAAASVLPTGLPAGALTVIRIRTTNTSNRDWDNTVADLIRATLASGRPVGYVPVDSDNPQQAIAKVAMRTGEGGRLGILLDEDHLVDVRDDRGLSRLYGCGIPTMSRVQEQVGGWEDDYGSSLVVLDGLEKARPYPATPQDLITFPNGITITRRALNEWRALEMSNYADSRPDAPTVVVWNDDGSPAHADAIEPLCDVAMVIVEAFSDPEGGDDFLTVGHRTDRNQRFPYQQGLRLG